MRGPIVHAERVGQKGRSGRPGRSNWKRATIKDGDTMKKPKKKEGRETADAVTQTSVETSEAGTVAQVAQPRETASKQTQTSQTAWPGGNLPPIFLLPLK